MTRFMLAAGSLLISLLIMELGARLFYLERVSSAAPPYVPARPPLQRESRPMGRGLGILAAGESTVLGEPYDPKISVPQLVATLLSKQEHDFPSTIKWVARKGGVQANLNQTVIEALETSPDLFIMVFGHNDYLGSFAPSTVCTRTSGILDRVSTRSALVRVLFDRYRRKDIGERPVEGDRSFFDLPVACTDTVERLFESIEASTRQIADKIRALNIPAVFVLPAGDLYDFAPNRSVHTGDPLLRREIEQAVRCGRGYLETGQLQRAEESLRVGLELDGTFAAAHFWLGRTLDAIGRKDEAHGHLQLASEHDGFPYRVQIKRNEIVRRVAEAYNISVVDASQVASDARRHGFLDGQLFHDVHHPTVTLYRALAERVAELLGPRIGVSSVTRFTSDDEVLMLRSYSALDWSRLFRSRSDWMTKFAEVTYDRAPRLASGVVFAEAATEIETSIPGLTPGQFSRDLRKDALHAIDVEQRAICSLGCQGLEEVCGSASPWLSSGTTQFESVVRDVWLPKARSAAPLGVHISGITASVRSCNLLCEDGTAPDGTGLVINGEMYLTGFGLHPGVRPSTLKVPLDGRFSRFRARVGIGDTGGPTGSARCSIAGDGKALFKTGVLRWMSAPVHLTVPVQGVQELEISCDDGGDGPDYDVVMWVAPRLD